MIVEIGWDYTEDIIWLLDDNEKLIDDEFSLIEKDKILLEIQNKINDLYSTFYEFESHNEYVWWDKAKMKENKQIMLNLLEQLNNRLNEINNETFIIKDNLTDYWKNI